MRRATKCATWVIVAALVLIVAALVLAPPGFTKGSFGGGGSKSFSGGGGSKSSSSRSGASKSVGGQKVSVSSSPKSYSTSKGAVPTASVKARIVPPVPPRVSARPGSAGSLPGYIPAGRNYQADRAALVRNDRYFMNTGRSFYGAYDSPFFYLWLAGAFNGHGGQDRPPLPAATKEIAVDVVPTLLGIIAAEAKEATG